MYIGIRLYNKIPKFFKVLSENQFKKSIETNLIKKAYYSVREMLEDSDTERESSNSYIKRVIVTPAVNPQTVVDTFTINIQRQRRVVARYRSISSGRR